MQFKCYTFYKITKVVCASNNIRIGFRGSAAYCDGPPVRVVWMGQRLPFLRRKNSSRIPVYYWTMYRHSLNDVFEQIRVILVEQWDDFTLTLTRSLLDMAGNPRAEFQSSKYHQPLLLRPRCWDGWLTVRYSNWLAGLYWISIWPNRTQSCARKAEILPSVLRDMTVFTP